MRFLRPIVESREQRSSSTTDRPVARCFARALSSSLGTNRSTRRRFVLLNQECEMVEATVEVALVELSRPRS